MAEQIYVSNHHTPHLTKTYMQVMSYHIYTIGIMYNFFNLVYDNLFCYMVIIVRNVGENEIKTVLSLSTYIPMWSSKS